MNLLQAFAPSSTQSSFLLIVKVLFGIVLFAGALPLAIGLVAKFADAQSSAAWPETVATITQSKVIRKGLGGKPAFSPEIAYTFDVAGKEFTGTRIALAASDSRSESEAAVLAQHYAIGTRHTVFFDPGNPQNCALEKGAGWFHYLVLLVPVAFFFGGLWMAWANGRAFWRRMKGTGAPSEQA